MMLYLINRNGQVRPSRLAGSNIQLVDALSLFTRIFNGTESPVIRDCANE